MSIETNATTKIPVVKDPINTFDIFKVEDLTRVALDAGLTAPFTAPDGVSRIPFVAGGVYNLRGNFVWPKMFLPITSSLTVQEFVSIRGMLASTNILVDGANDGIPIFWGRNINAFELMDITLIDVGNSGAAFSATIFDCVGAARPSAFRFNQVVFVRVADMGETTNIVISFPSNVNIVSAERGLVNDQSPNTVGQASHSITSFRTLNSFAVSSNGPYYGWTGAQETITALGGNTNFIAGDSLFRIDGNSVGDYNITASAFNGIGDLLSPGNTASITQYSANNLTINSFSDSTANPGVDTTVNLAVITKFKIGQSVLVAGEAAYNGPRVIVLVADDQLSFDINVAFSTSGAGTLDQVQITSSSHGFMLNENMSITASTNYNADHVINQIVDNNTYEIPFTFVSDDGTGTATSISKIETDQGVQSDLNGSAPRSRRIAAANMNGNTQGTSISTADAYIGINFSMVINDSLVTERFTLTNTTTGIYQYDDPRPITVAVNALIWTNKAGSIQNYRFALNKNANTPVFTESITSVTDSSGIARFNFTAPPTVSVGQKIVIKDFVTNSDYNGTFILDTVGAGFFEINSIAFGTNEVVGVFESPYSPVEVKGDIVISVFSEFIDLEQNDTLRIDVAPDGHTDDIACSDFKIAISSI